VPRVRARVRVRAFALTRAGCARGQEHEHNGSKPSLKKAIINLQQSSIRRSETPMLNSQHAGNRSKVQPFVHPFLDENAKVTFRCLGAAKPETGKELACEQLAQKLRLLTLEISQEELIKFRLEKELRADHFIKVDDLYFEPMTAMQMASYDPAKKWTWFLASEGFRVEDVTLIVKDCGLFKKVMKITPNEKRAYADAASISAR
jgi:hypothetical protein